VIITIRLKEHLDLDHKKEVIMNNRVQKHVLNILILHYNIMESVFVIAGLHQSKDMEKANVPVD